MVVVLARAIQKGHDVEVHRNDENIGRLVLAAFQHYAVTVGEALLQQNITAYAWNNSRSSADVKVGLRYACKQHWVAKSRNGPIVLTYQGFEEIRSH